MIDLGENTFCMRCNKRLCDCEGRISAAEGFSDKNKLADLEKRIKRLEEKNGI